MKKRKDRMKRGTKNGRTVGKKKRGKKKSCCEGGKERKKERNKNIKKKSKWDR